MTRIFHHKRDIDRTLASTVPDHRSPQQAGDSRRRLHAARFDWWGTRI